MCQRLSNGAQNAGFGDGRTLTKGINTIKLKAATFMLPTHLTNIAARSNAGLPAPDKLEALEDLTTCR
jgi:hypothetical protein